MAIWVLPRIVIPEDLIFLFRARRAMLFVQLLLLIAAPLETGIAPFALYIISLILLVFHLIIFAIIRAEIAAPWYIDLDLCNIYDDID